jgi:hypothetical protein
MKCRTHFALLPDIFCFEAMPSRSELEIDRFWQPIEQHLDVGMVRRALAFGMSMLARIAGVTVASRVRRRDLLNMAEPPQRI